MIKYFTNNISVIALLSVLAAVSTVIMGGIVRVTGSGLCLLYTSDAADE